MSDTKIEWADKTWNLLGGCTWKSEGCDNCYAANLSLRLAKMAEKSDDPNHGLRKYVGVAHRKSDGKPAFLGKIHTSYIALNDISTIKTPSCIFVNSMSDTFHKDVPDDFLDRIFAKMFEHPQHTFMLLTKRPDRASDYVNSRWPKLADTAPHIQVGTSAENQARYDERIAHLVEIPAKVRFLSCEPLLGEINLDLDFYAGGLWPGNGIQWVIAGGESSHGARPCHPDWVRSIRDQCVAAEVPFHFKQWGEWLPFGMKHKTWDVEAAEYYESLNVAKYEFYEPSRRTMYKVGKKAAGRLLDGQLWDQFPA